MRTALVGFALALLVGCGPVSGQANTGTVEGTVMGWPGPTNHEIPATNAQLRFLDDAGHVATTATTDSNGKFAASMPAGNYQLLVTAFGRDAIILSSNGSASKTSQVYVTVKAGMNVKVDLLVDSGSR
jgi:hypothetical protein